MPLVGRSTINLTLIPKGSLPQQAEEANRENRPTQVHLENGRQNRGENMHFTIIYYYSGKPQESRHFMENFSPSPPQKAPESTHGTGQRSDLIAECTKCLLTEALGECCNLTYAAYFHLT